MDDLSVTADYLKQPGTALDPVFTLGQQIGAVHGRHVQDGRTRQAVL